MAKTANNKKSNNAVPDNTVSVSADAGNPYKIGDIVLALSGRDKARLFAVVGILDQNYVLIADGRSRRADAPKKKKIRHIKLITDISAGETENKFNLKDLKGGRFTNLILRNMITEYAKKLNKN